MLHKCPQNIAKCRKIDRIAIIHMYQHLPLKDPQKLTQIGILGFKIYHLATLVLSRSKTFRDGCSL
jgi:hypothetical protein